MPDNVYIFDTSSLIFLWDNYPIENKYFHGLWFGWFANKVNGHRFLISEVAYQETIDNAEEFIAWREENEINFNILPRVSVDADVATAIERQLEIRDENDYGKGVNYNDILIIAIAKRANAILVSNEARQDTLPDNLANYKIPTVCKLPTVNVPCINLADLLKREPN